MKTTSTLLCIFACWCFGSRVVFADKLLLLNNQTANGIILRTNATDLLVLNDYGTINWPRSIVREIKIEPVSFETTTERFPKFKTILMLLNKQPWASDLKQIPATVIDQGIMRNVPYVSVRCADDYEVNIYGDLDRPVGIEVGVYRKLLENETAKRNCLNFINDLLTKAEDKNIISHLGFDQSLTNRDGLTFEITPPSAADAYGGWWVSMYSSTRMEFARASDDELKEISTPKTQNKASGETPWTTAELKCAREVRPMRITVSAFGMVFTNAEIVRVNEGVSLFWRSGSAMGTVKLAELPKDVQDQFGYDPVKSAAAEAAEKERRLRQAEQEQREIQQAQVEASESAQRMQAAAIAYRGGYTSSYGTSSSSYSGGRVYVRGYTRSNGTYVHSYTRSAPGRR